MQFTPSWKGHARTLIPHLLALSPARRSSTSSKSWVMSLMLNISWPAFSAITASLFA